MEFIFDTNTLESAHLDCESDQIEGEIGTPHTDDLLI